MAPQNYNKWDGQPRLLSDEEIAEPMKVIHEVFDYAHLPDLRNSLWEWLKTTISGNFNKGSFHYKDRESLLAFYEKMQKLLEAAHLLLVSSKLSLPAKQHSTLISIPTKDDANPPLAPAIELVPIIDKLVALFAPEYLFEVSSLQELNNPTPIYFFLLVLPNTATRTYAECSTGAENACTQWGTVQLITVKQNELQKYLQEGHLLTPLLAQKINWYMPKKVSAYPQYIPVNWRKK